jgi:hypothetical protein
MPSIQLNVLWAGVETPIKYKYLKDALKRFGNEVVKIGQTNLKDQKKNTTGNLSKSLTYKIADNSVDIVSIEFIAPNASYWKFVNWGVKGLISSAKAPNSPFQFGSGNFEGKGTLRGAIDKWVVQKPVGPIRDDKGRFTNRKGMVRAISRSIYLNGIAPSYFYSSAFERGWKRNIGKIEDALGEDYAVFLEGKIPPEIMVTLEI